jgi:hypothetical protein
MTDIERTPQRIRIEQHSAVGVLWFIGWLFTIGYLQLGFTRAVLALLLWPYYLGVYFAPVVEAAG